MSSPTIDRSLPLVLVGSSLGPESDEVVRSGLVGARDAAGRLVLLHVLEPQGDVAAGLLAFPMVREGLFAASREQLAAQLRRLGALSCDVAEVSVELPPVDVQLLAAADRLQPRVVVIGANRDDPPSLRLGQLAARLLRRSRWPVWLVKGRTSAMPSVYVFEKDEPGDRERMLSLAREAECPLLIVPASSEVIPGPFAARGVRS
jgi:nucleotide-binding universal stress UspA family protein